jgi:hypothetical protein
MIPGLSPSRTRSLQLEIRGQVFQTFGPGSNDPGFESWSDPITLSSHVHQCSLTDLSKAEWCVDCLWALLLLCHNGPNHSDEHDAQGVTAEVV